MDSRSKSKYTKLTFLLTIGLVCLFYSTCYATGLKYAVKDKSKSAVVTFTVASSTSNFKQFADYRADGTADEVTIQAAIDALPTEGGSIVLLDGTFDIAAAIELPVRVVLNIEISGQGRSTILSHSATDSSDCISVVGTGTVVADRSRGLVLKDFNIVGNSSSGDGIYLNGVHFSTLQNIWMQDGGGYGLKVDTAGSTSYNNVVVDNYALGGLYFDDIHQNRIIGNHASNCEGPGMTVATAFEALISGNALEYNDDANLYINGPNVISYMPGTIVGNVMTSAGGSANNHGIHVSNAYRWVITGNTIGVNPADGIFLENSHINVISSNNMFRNAGTSFDIDNSSFNIISNNAITGNGTDTISEDSDSLYNKKLNNHPSSEDEYIGYGAGIKVDRCETAWTAKADVTSTRQAASGGWIMEGSYGCQHIIASGFTTGLVSTFDFSAINMTPYTKVGLWMRSTSNISANVLQLVLDDTAACASPIETLNLPAFTENIWKYTELTLNDPTLLGAIISVGINAASDPGGVTVRFDDINTEYPSMYFDKSVNELRIANPVHIGIGVNPQVSLEMNSTDQSPLIVRGANATAAAFVLDSIGFDDSDSDVFKFSQSVNIGTNDRLAILNGAGSLTLSSDVGTTRMRTYQNDTLADTAEINLPASTSGFLHVGMMEEGGMAIISTDGTVTLTAGITANVTTTNNNDGKLNIYDAGNYAVVENQLGGPRETRIIYWYN